MHFEKIDKFGNKTPISYSTNVKATTEIEWQNAEREVGWNYKTDSIIYKAEPTAVIGDIQIHSITFDDNPITIGNNDFTIEEAHSVLGPMIIKEMLDPSHFLYALESEFEKKAETLEQ